ncbi:hypothetical protein C9374_004607 [Naegleria lovaniensis]|uniref:DNA replication complex GINS protein PSF1 C-terminal domain-containing protein n=1 Tax=Naegleria lovaniensis TaxID=51637 RepID=A0AA88KL54_NAELO|nr:uncharacterized protein C9374_004607 [Naegleria lovaniensis]KAG2383270.1 hypothetical protein C9374_004607 [Naegleria lovaniensis]
MEKSLQLLHELNQTRDNVLPAFNTELVSSVIREINSLSEQIFENLVTQNTQSDQVSEEDLEKLRMSSAVTFTIYERYKRILLAYLHTRLERVKTISTLHTHESINIENTKQWKDFSDNEQRFATEYRKLVESYGEDIGFDMFKFIQPPKGDCVEVEVLQTSGSRLLESGKTYHLVQGSHLFIQLSDAEYLIQQGLVKLVS